MCQRDSIDVAALNAATEMFVAEMLRNALERLDSLGVGEHPEMTCIPGYRAYLKRFDAALASSASEGPEVPQSAPHLRLVG